MHTLFYSPGACSLSPHIALREAGLVHTLVRVDLRSKKTREGEDYKAINPKGYVPALRLPGGEVLTEGPAIVQYIADQRPEANLAPPAGTLGRYRLVEWLNFISTELHKAFSPLFNSNAQVPVEYKTMVVEGLERRFGYLSEQLAGKDFLMGSQFTVADGYLFTVLSWTRLVSIDLSRWPVLQAYRDRVAARPAVREAMQAEGLK